MAKANKTNSQLFTAHELDSANEFPMFESDKKRLSYMKQHYSKFDLVKAFSLYYNENVVTTEKKLDKSLLQPTTISLGEIVSAKIKRITGDTIEFDVPGVKEEVVCNEHFDTDSEQFNLYLAKHNDTLSFEVREFKRGKWIVSVMNAYYCIWKNSIERAIKREDGIHMHIERLTRGGFIASTPVWTLQELTGKEYTACCFIPGSQIIMSIETDFDKWVGQDVVAVPQKFGTYRKETGAPMEDSVICSRKRCLQKIAIQNLYQMFTTKKLKDSLDGNSQAMTYAAKVTGVINSKQKTGVFVEIDDLFVTGIVPVDADELINYVPNQRVDVELVGFDTADGQEPFIIKNDRIIKCQTKPVFRLLA